jgi:uncharacterized membrane protein HdeD (DUF308 family)
MSEAGTTQVVGDARTRKDIGAAASVWWIYLIPGFAWLLLAVIVFRFDWTTVSSISILFGLVMLAAAVNELFAFGASSGWWKVARAALAVAFAVLAIVSFVHPGNTFAALAAVMSFYFVIMGGFEIALAIGTRHEHDLWWLSLLVGIALLLLGFWAAGNFGHAAILLVVWVGATALARGISEIIFAFTVRQYGSAQ